MKLPPSTRTAQIACALSLFALPITSQAALVGHWAFDEGTGETAADSSGNGNDGSITDATWGSDVERDSYLIFNGQTSVVDPSVVTPVMTTTNNYSWAGWVNSQVASTVGIQKNAILFGNRKDTNGNDFVPRQFIKVTPLQFEWHQNDNGNDNLDVPDLEVDGWHHIAVVKTGTALEYFFDGVSIGNHTLTETIGLVENPFYIGGQPNHDSNTEHFEGFIDDVRIYDNALSAAEVIALATNVVSPNEIEFTAITIDADGNIDLTWTSEADGTYSLDVSTSLNETGQPGGWQNIDDGIASGGATTSLNLPATAFPLANTHKRLFFRASEITN